MPATVKPQRSAALRRPADKTQQIRSTDKARYYALENLLLGDAKTLAWRDDDVDPDQETIRRFALEYLFRYQDNKCTLERAEMIAAPLKRAVDLNGKLIAYLRREQEIRLERNCA